MNENVYLIKTQDFKQKPSYDIVVGTDHHAIPSYCIIKTKKIPEINTHLSRTIHLSVWRVIKYGS